MKVEIWSDIACPWCYVGKRRFERALSSFSHRDEVEIVWRSFELDPNAPSATHEPVAEMLARKYRIPVAQAEAMNARLAGEGKKEGIDFRFDRVRLANTFDAHRLIHFAAVAGHREAMVERLMRAYFADGEALGDVDTLVRLATEIGLDENAARLALVTDAFAADVRADEERARAFGISGVPFFAIDERYGVSGAQPPENLLDALRQAWSESAPAKATDAMATAGVDTAVDAAVGTAADCADGSCAI